jgi:hypothetical protein
MQTIPRGVGIHVHVRFVACYWAKRGRAGKPANSDLTQPAFSDTTENPHFRLTPSRPLDTFTPCQSTFDML